MPEPGRLKGLSLILDAHSDLVGSSSVPDDFQVLINLNTYWSTLIKVQRLLVLGIYCCHRLKESVPFGKEEKLSDSAWPHGFLYL